MQKELFYGCTRRAQTFENLLCVAGVFVESFNVMGQTPLFVAAYTRRRRVTATLLNLGADPNVRCLGGYTAVHAACFAGSVDVLASMLKYNGDLSIHDVHRQIPT